MGVVGLQGAWKAQRLVVAEDLVPKLRDKLGCTLRVLGTLSGVDLAGCLYQHPLFERKSPVVVGGEYITTESGTGLVHTAPGHGQEDYQARHLSTKNITEENRIVCSMVLRLLWVGPVLI